MNRGRHIERTTVALRSLLVLLALLGSGCATAPDGALALELGGGPVLRAPEPGGLGRSLAARQLVSLQVGGKSLVFQAQIEASTKHLRLAGLDPLGRRVVTLDWRRGKLEVTAAEPLRQALDGRRLLAYLVFIYWPESEVRKSLSGGKWQLHVSANSRELRRGTSTLIQVDYATGWSQAWQHRTRMKHFGQQFTLTINSILLP